MSQPRAFREDNPAMRLGVSHFNGDGFRELENRNESPRGIDPEVKVRKDQLKKYVSPLKVRAHASYMRDGIQVTHGVPFIGSRPCTNDHQYPWWGGKARVS